MLPKEVNQHYKVLDLGCGNGLLSELIAKQLPDVSLVGFDITDEMLEFYRHKISAITPGFETIQGDYRNDDIGEGYDIIVSGMTLHHLTHNERKLFYDRLYTALNPGGVYISNDIIMDENPTIKADQYNLWKDFMKENGEDPEFWYGKHMEKDHPLSLTQQIEWLSASGFVDVGCYWRNYNFAITKARKL